MSTLLIEGGQRLSGAVDVEGNKNSALPLLAACLLTVDECVLTNVPRISDVEVMARLILDLGGQVEGIGSTTLRVRCPQILKDEPHVAELCAFLVKLGAGISGAGTPTIRIEGGAKLHGAEHRLWGDYIEAGSWAVVAGVTGGEIEIHGARGVDMEVVAAVLTRMQIACVMDGEIFRVEQSRPRAAGRITTSLWPGFPSDLVSLVTVLATQAEGQTLVHDWMYELRLFALEQLSGMAADLFLCDPHRIIVTGPRSCGVGRWTVVTCDRGWRSSPQRWRPMGKAG